MLILLYHSGSSTLQEHRGEQAGLLQVITELQVCASAKPARYAEYCLRKADNLWLSRPDRQTAIHWGLLWLSGQAANFLAMRTIAARPWETDSRKLRKRRTVSIIYIEDAPARIPTITIHNNLDDGKPLLFLIIGESLISACLIVVG